jgi:hypothetical protein
VHYFWDEFGLNREALHGDVRDDSGPEDNSLDQRVRGVLFRVFLRWIPDG